MAATGVAAKFGILAARLKPGFAPMACYMSVFGDVSQVDAGAAPYALSSPSLATRTSLESVSLARDSRTV